MKTILIDDEPLALEYLEILVNEFQEVDLIGIFQSSLKAFEFLSESDVDLIIMDIQMPGINGIELAKKIGKGKLIIFTTAFDQYAIEGFTLDVVDYILKPVEKERLKLAIEKADRLFSYQLLKRRNEPILIQSQHRQFNLLKEEILYAEGLKDYVKIHLTGERPPILTRINLKTFSTLVKSKEFLRVHKSFIINYTHASQKMKDYFVINGKEIPIGASYKASIADFEKVYK